MGYRGIKTAVGPALEILYQPWIRGEENIPVEGAAILASNHLAVIDSFFLPLLVDREVAFIGKSDYFTGKGAKGWVVKNFMTAVGTIPVDRSGGQASQAALQAGIDRLNSGELFGIYPRHPQPRRPSLPRKDRGGAHRAGHRGPGHSGGHDRLEPGSAHWSGHPLHTAPGRYRCWRAARFLPVQGAGERPLRASLHHR